MAPWKILLADDEPELLKIYRFVLEGMGHSVEACANGEQALERFHKADGDFDMLLTDYRMPALTGLELAQILRLFNPSLPVMIISGMCGDMRDAAIAASGNIICLPKPLRYGELEGHIRSLQQVTQGQ